jgi:hypothetical protein
LSNFPWGICHAVTSPTAERERKNSLRTSSNVLSSQSLKETER